MILRLDRWQTGLPPHPTPAGLPKEPTGVVADGGGIVDRVKSRVT